MWPGNRTIGLWFLESGPPPGLTVPGIEDKVTEMRKNREVRACGFQSPPGQAANGWRKTEPVAKAPAKEGREEVVGG